MALWSHLVNAIHIDRVIASANAHPAIWYHAWDQVLLTARRRHWPAALETAWDQAWQQARAQAWYHARDKVSRQVTGPLTALIAYDDSAKYLNLPIDQLQMLYHLTEHPACLLLQPAVLAFAKERELA